MNESDYATSDQFLSNKLGGRTETVAMTQARENQASAKDWYKEKFKYGKKHGMFTIDSIQLVPGQSILIGTTTENVTVLVDETGITVTGDLQSNSTARRQLLQRFPDSGQSPDYLVGDVTVEQKYPRCKWSDCIH